MATTSMDITSFVGKLLEQDDVDALREGVRVLAQAVMETEVSSQIGAAPYERSSERVAYRNGYRTRRWDTRVGRLASRSVSSGSGTTRRVYRKATARDTRFSTLEVSAQ
jgi:transposase-like protein